MLLSELNTLVDRFIKKFGRKPDYIVMNSAYRARLELECPGCFSGNSIISLGFNITVSDDVKGFGAMYIGYLPLGKIKPASNILYFEKYIKLSGMK